MRSFDNRQGRCYNRFFPRSGEVVRALEFSELTDPRASVGRPNQGMVFSTHSLFTDYGMFLFPRICSSAYRCTYMSPMLSVKTGDDVPVNYD